MFKGFEALSKIEGIEVAENPAMGGEVSLPMEKVFIKEVVIKDAGPYKKEINEWKAENGL